MRFFVEEYPYYDGIPSADPDRIDPVDVLATVSVNSFVNDAAKVRRIHRGLATTCELLLPAVPLDANLSDADPPLTDVRLLLEAAVTVPGVLIPVATKVLHRKRPALVPMLDAVVINYYAEALGQPALRNRKEDKSKAASVAMVVLDAFRQDLLARQQDLAALGNLLDGQGYPVTAVRVLEVLLWTEIEPRGYYTQPATGM
jgi:hypothetical protein